MKNFDEDICRRPAEKFKALGHPVRLWIAQQLLDGEHCVGEFVEQTNFDYSTISQHLTVLKQADVIKGRKHGKEVYYSLVCECVRTFLACVAAHQKNGECKEMER